MQVRKPDAPIRASPPMPLKKAPEHSPMADSSRLTATWRNRVSASNRAMREVIQPSGRLATSEMPQLAAVSAMAAATASRLACLSLACRSMDRYSLRTYTKALRREKERLRARHQQGAEFVPEL